MLNIEPPPPPGPSITESSLSMFECLHSNFTNISKVVREKTILNIFLYVSMLNFEPQLGPHSVLA